MTTTRLSPNGYSLPKSDFTPRELDALKRELTAVPFVPGGHGGPAAAAAQQQQQSFRVWQESAARIYVPKCFGLARFGAPAKDTLPTGSALPSNLRFSGMIRAEQTPAVEAFMAAASDPLRRGGIVSLPCGGGKTVIALNIVARVAKKTMIVVHKDFLLRQWYDRISAFLPDARVGLVKAKTVDVRDKDIVLASLQSLSMKEYPDDIFADLGLLVIDEVHRTGTEVFSRALQKVSVSCCLGLSATVTRKDGMTKVFTWFIGDVVFARAPSLDDRVDVVLRPYHHSAPEYAEEPEGYGGKPNVSRMINNVTSFFPRTRALCDAVVEVLREQPRRRVLVLSDRKQHLCDIAECLKGADVDAGMYVGGMKARDLEASAERTVILATFSFASEGFDVPGLDTLVLASPKTDIEQSVGRVLRQRQEDRAHVPLVLDVVDEFSVFRNQAKKRRAYYKKRGYAVSSRPLTSRSVESNDDGDEADASSAPLLLQPTAFSFLPDE